MTLLSLNNVAVSFGAEDVLEGITAAINSGDRIGLVGRNGAGKTTLLHVLEGSLEATKGGRSVARGLRVALVEQVPPVSASGFSVHQEALSSVEGLIRLESRLQEAAAALAEAHPGAAEAYAQFQHEFELAGGFTYQARLNHVLAGLGFPVEEFDTPVSQLSGGQRSRLGLAKALLAEPGLLLIDEPTNHLDFAGLQWLEDFLRRWKGALVVTSHDRYFLDRAVNHVWYLEGRRLRAYRGNYSAFQQQHTRQAARQQAEHEAQRQYVAKEEAFIRRYRAGQRAREARGRATRLARLQRIAAPSKSRDAVITLGASRSGDLVISSRSLVIGYDATPLLNVPDIEVERGSRIALIGPNGIGKTTLLRTLSGELPPVEGSVHQGAGVRIAHYWQEAEDLDQASTVLDEVMRDSSLKPQEARDLLGLMLFSGDDVFKLVGDISGGERSRLALARLMTSRANLLLLDEPTNHLDIPSREALEEALDRYQGTLIFASHDRRLISRLSGRLWIVEAGRLTAFEGRWEEYQQKQEPAPATSGPRRPPRLPPQASSTRKREADISRLEAEIAAIEEDLLALGREVDEASALGNLPALGESGRRFEGARDQLERLVDEWSRLQS